MWSTCLRYATLCGLAGVDPTDGDGSVVPALDSLDVWPALLVPNGTQSPRTRIPLAFCAATEQEGCTAGDNALIVGQCVEQFQRVFNAFTHARTHVGAHTRARTHACRRPP